jgi:diacylglycerol kinase (ATP)
MAGIGVVLNPKSRRNLQDPDLALRLSRQLGAGGVVRAARSIEELRRIAEEFRTLNIDLLAIAGGDGTNHVTLTGFLDVYGDKPIPPVALLRGGTMNTVANSVGVARQSSERLLARLIADRASTRLGEGPQTTNLGPEGPQTTNLGLAERNVLRVTPQGAGEIHCGFLFGTGVVHGFLAEYYRRGSPTPLVAAATLARGIASAFVEGETIRRIAEPFHGSVLFEDGTLWEEQNYLAVAAGTIAHIGLEFKPFHRYAEQVGAFHALGIYAPASALVRELPRVWRGLPMRPGCAHEALSSRMVVKSAAGPVKYMVDGDLHEAREVLSVSMGPRIRLVVVR